MKTQKELTQLLSKKVEEISLSQQVDLAKQIMIEGTIMVEFMMRTDQFEKPQQLADYMKRQLEGALKKEWQTSQMEPVMSSFKYKQVK